jgi:intein/homing endonuclease
LAAWARGKTLLRAPLSAAGASFKVRDDHGKELDATFRVEPVGNRLSIVFEARGGTRGSKDARNADYDDGLQKILDRLKALGLSIEDALVDSRITAHLSPKDRRIPGDYPLVLEDASAVRRRLRAGQQRVGRAAGARGAGNSTKRIRLIVYAPTLSAESLSRTLETGA